MTRYTPTDIIGHNTLLVIVSCGLLLFFTLGAREVQSWDEAQFALRARAVVERSAWWDQSSFLPSGAPASVVPPLSVWAMATVMKPMKMSPFSIRLFSVICAFASLFLIHRIALFLLSKKTAMLAPALLAGSLVWNHYARQGMSDIPMLTFCLLALWSMLRVLHEKQPSVRLGWSALFALSIAATLLTKNFVSLLPLGFLFYFVCASLCVRFLSKDPSLLLAHFAQSPAESKSRFILLSIAAGMGVVIALPWYVHMLQSQALSVSQLFRFSADNSHLSGFWYQGSTLAFLHHFIAQQPLCFFAFVWCVIVSIKRKQAFTHSQDVALEALLGIWFLFGLLGLWVVSPSSPVNLLLILPPAILLALRGIELLTQFFGRHKRGLMVMGGAIACVVWSAVTDIHPGVQQQTAFQFSVESWLYIGGTALFILPVFLLKEGQRLSVYMSLHWTMMTLIPILLVARVAVLNTFLVDDRAQGSQKVAQWLEQTQTHEFMYIFHQENAADSLAPQLSWYTKGWAGFSTASPWREAHQYHYRALKAMSFDSSSIASLEGYDYPIVYRIPSDTALRSRDEHEIQRVHRIRLISPAYIIFSRRGYTNTEPDNEAELRSMHREQESIHRYAVIP